MTAPHALGRLSFQLGEMRIVPRDILIVGGKAAAEDWYRGWDAANLEAPVEEVADGEV